MLEKYHAYYLFLFSIVPGETEEAKAKNHKNVENGLHYFGFSLICLFVIEVINISFCEPLNKTSHYLNIPFIWCMSQIKKVIC